MEATPLRIGNIVNYILFPNVPESAIHVVVSKISDTHITFIDGDDKAYPIDDFSPSPLTEEWLLKFGFVKVLDYPCFRLEGLQIEFNGFDSQWGTGLLDEKTVIKYVHQLQNLFFALKGKELTLK